MDKRLEYMKNELRSSSAMKLYKQGFRYMWKCDGPHLTRIGLEKEGGPRYSKTNQMGGVMFAMPGEVSITEKQAKAIMLKCFMKKVRGEKLLTFSMLKTVRKTLSFAYQLQGGEPGGNFKSVASVWSIVREEKTAPKKLALAKPTCIPTPADLKLVLTRGWNPVRCGPLLKWSVGLLGFWDWGVLGSRATEDMDKIKKGREHVVNHTDGWAWSEFFEGRAKLPMAKRGTREWKAWRVCLCPGGVHVPVPEDVQYDPSLLENPTWCVECPVNAEDLVLRCQYNAPCGELKIYRKVSKNKKKLTYFTGNSEGDIVAVAMDWMRVQGVNKHFDRNAGRSSLAAWCRHLHVPYSQSFEYHGDLPDTWAEHYERNMVYEREFTRRTQSTHPPVALAGLRKFACFLKRGPAAPKPKLTKGERMMVAMLEGMGMKEKARRLAYDLPSEDEEDELQALVGRPPARRHVKKSRRKRARGASKSPSKRRKKRRRRKDDDDFWNSEL